MHKNAIFAFQLSDVFLMFMMMEFQYFYCVFTLYPIIGNGFPFFCVCLTFGINTSSVWNFHLNWIFPQHFIFFHYRMFHPPTK